MVQFIPVQSIRINPSAKSSVLQLLISTRRSLPQGSVLGPLLFILYVADIAGIADRHGIQSHFYADDAQLYLTCHRSEVTATTSRLTCCIDEIARWLASNRLMLNPAKTDLFWCTAKGSPPDVSVTPQAASTCGLLPMSVTLAFCSIRLQVMPLCHSASAFHCSIFCHRCTVVLIGLVL